MVTEREQGELARQTDRQLVSRFVARRDESAFREIVRRYGPLVLGVCRRTLGEVHAAEDAFQATFLVLARDARKIRRRKNLSCWLHGVAYRISAQAAKREYRYMEPLLDDLTEDRRSVLEHIAHRHDQRMVDEELRKLPERDRESLTLRYLEDQSNGEIAASLGISLSAVESRLKRAKSRLRRQLLRRGVSLSVFFGVLVESQIELQAVETLIPGTVELGLSEAGGKLIDGSVAHELARTEIGEMAMVSKQVFAVAAAVLVTVGSGMYGLSDHVVGQDATNKITISSSTNEALELDVVLAATLDEQAAKRRPGKRPALRRYISPRLETVQSILDALETDVTLEFEDEPLEDVVEYLRGVKKIRIIIDRRALDDVGLGTDTPVTFNINGITFRSALKLMLKELDLTYVIRDEVLKITTPEEAEHELQLHVYMVDDFGIGSETLTELIIKVIAPDTWNESGGAGRIAGLGGAKPGLVVAQTQEVHEQISDFLEQLSRGLSE